ncbi:MAG: PAS domain S-box protein [Syntrophobacteraceae bacterium]
MRPDSRYSLAEHKVDSILEVLRGRSQGRLLRENDRLLQGVLNDLTDAMEELRAAHAEVYAQREELAEACREEQREHQRYVELFEDAPDGYVVTDLHGIIEQANLAAAELFDSARDFIVGKPLALFVDKVDKTAFFQQLNKMDALEAIKDWELRLQPWKGTSFWASINLAKVQIPEHEDISLRWLIRDIASRKQAEEFLRRYALLAGQGRDIILFIRRDDGRILEANAAAVKAYGYSYETLLTMTIHDLRAPDTRMLTQGQMDEAESRGALFETFHRRKDGSIFPVEVSSRGETIEGARTLISVVRNITQRKRTEDIIHVRLNLLEFATSHSVEELLQKILDEICALLDSPIGFLHFVESDQKTLSLQAWSTRTLGEFCTAVGKGAHYPIEKAGVWVDCVREKRPVIHNDYPALPHRKGLPDGHPPVIREISIPIMRSGRVVAILGIGNKPEDYTQEDIEAASYLADIAWEITQRKRVEEELRENQSRLDLALRSSRMGAWRLDIAENRRWFDDQVCHLLGIAPAEFTGTADEVLNVIHPDDRRATSEALARAIEHDGLYEAEYRVVHPDSSIHYLASRGRAVRDDNGRPVRMNGIIWEITPQKLAEEKLKKAYQQLNATLESITDGFISVDREWRITYLNKSGAKMLGTKRKSLIGGVFWELFPEVVKLEFYPRFRDAVESGAPVHFEGCYPNSPLNKWWECHAYPSSEGLSVYFRDITESKLIEDTQVFLAQCGRVASGEDFFESLARYLALSLGMDFVCIDRLEGDCLSARTLAVYSDGKFADNMTYTLKDTPCCEVVEKKICCFPKGVHRLFPRDVILQEMKAESYAGTILWGSKGQAIGLIAVIGRQPLANRRLTESMLQLVAVRAAGELERKRVEEELRESRSRLDLALQSAHMGVWDLDLKENKRRFDYQVCHLLGIDPAKFTGTEDEFYKALHPDDHDMVKAAWARTIEQDMPYETEYRAFRPDGSVHYLTARGKVIRDGKGQPVRINGLIWDISERKRMEEELRKSHDELELRVQERTVELNQAGKRLRSLASELLNSGENERKLIAQEIHDGLSSQLAAIKFCMERELFAERDAGQSGESIKRSCAMIQNAIEQTRRILANLRPSILDDLGILPTITWLCREFQEMNPSIDPVIKFEISEEDIPADIKTVIFRLLQEALNNIRKYSRAERVEVSLRMIGSSIVFLIKDNGQGFNPKKVLSERKIGCGFGLRGMLERVELSGGKCDVKSAPGKGVSIWAEWNIKS